VARLQGFPRRPVERDGREVRRRMDAFPTASM
jgi:hypothetical protein